MSFLVQNLTYGYDPHRPPILDNIDVELPTGGVIALLGPSGCGKTTLLNLLGLLAEESNPHRKGSILYRDPQGKTYAYTAQLSASARSAFRLRRFGFVPQHCHFLRGFTVEQNILMPLLIQGNAQARERLESLLRCAEAAHGSEGTTSDPTSPMRAILQRSPLGLSGGEEQRTAILRAVVHDPEVVFADEPVSNLDVTNKELMKALLKAWLGGELHPDSAEHPRTLILVCHDLDTAWEMVCQPAPGKRQEAIRAASRILFLNARRKTPGSDGCRLVSPEEFVGDVRAGVEKIRKYLDLPTDLGRL